MNGCSEYKEIQCIVKMGKDYRKKFDKIVCAYAEKLSSRIVDGESAYTLHDFNHHCFDIYKIISDVLFDEELVYKEGYGLTKRELLILNLAVLFHDIGMANVLGAKRESHSESSAEYVQREYDDARSALKKEADLTKVEIKALKAIIVAHSDVKKWSGIDKESGMQSQALKNYKSKSGSDIRTKFLAGVLRLADELDVSVDRLGSAEIEQEIEERKETDLKHQEGYLKSLEHWKRLHYIECVQRNTNKKDIELVIDDEYVDKCLDKGSTEKAIARDLIDIHQKIDKELKEIIGFAFCGAKERNYVPVDRLTFVTENKNLEKDILNGLSRMSLKETHFVDTEKKKDQSVSEVPLPAIIDEYLEKNIYQEVNERNLLKFGHFLLDETFCARDWIDTKEVMETKKISNNIVEAMVKHINSKFQGNYIIIGIDLMGAMLASRVAFSLQKPLSYIISSRNKKNNANSDIEIDVNQFEKIILVTDVIVTYETIIKAVEDYNLEDKIMAIYTVFYRTSENSKIIDDVYLPKTYSVNNMFMIETFEKRKCIYKENLCIAQNRKID